MSRNDKAAIQQLGLDLESAVNQREPIYNLCPMMRAPVVFQGERDLEIHAFKWGLMPSWAKDTKDASKRINAKVETVTKLPSYRVAFKKRRCLVPMSAYYEWKGDKPPKQPYLIHKTDNTLLMAAGLWEVWKDPKDPGAEWLRTFTVITGEPGKVSGDIHDRQPVFLPSDRWEHWLLGTPEEAEQAIRDVPEPDLTYFPISKAINNPRNQGPELIQEVTL
ncbi:SOS response-associated peptidase (plasmid) [Dyella sp. BiH032]|uniref:SOS response-associated peptidase n=1 Tax=Dyella sp. BiH032 TaxID=3075430 RepID=UPI002892D31D|nr:SOS response-associated peptidase [Dyella sp. BiH032]WNL48370.1 SOS response-associated peptidase [Dyella sp. BiH032]